MDLGNCNTRAGGWSLPGNICPPALNWHDQGECDHYDFNFPSLPGACASNRIVQNCFRNPNALDFKFKTIAELSAGFTTVRVLPSGDYRREGYDKNNIKHNPNLLDKNLMYLLDTGNPTISVMS